MPELSKKLLEKLENSFLWFWVKQYKVSFLFIILIFIMWSGSLYTIPKDSAPKLDLWYISIVTPYIWVNPADIDSLITEKIEREIKDIEWIKKIESSSVLWMSNITLELEIDADSKDVMDEVKDEVDKISLPWWAEDTIFTEISTEDNMIFQYMLYWDENIFNQDYLISLAADFKNNLESSWFVNKVVVKWTEDFEVQVLLDKEKSEVLWISPSLVSSKIREFNKNTPIWNYRIDDLNYDFRFEWEVKNIQDFKQIPIATVNSSVVYLSDIAEIEIDYDNDSIVKFWKYSESWFNGVILNIERKPTESIFSAAEKAKKAIEEELNKPIYSGIQWDIMTDMSDILRDDYKSLAKNLLTTLTFVFLIIFVFVGLKEGIISIIIIPLAYLITFIVLDKMWYALNFLTNFSLILSLWVAIDTIIVVIEWAHKKVNLGYNPRHAILLATREYAAPIISWTMTTLAAFLPMMFLPWVMWKYLAYVPITVFITLLASLFLSLTVTSPIFMKLVKDSKLYKVNKSEEDVLSEWARQLLTHDRAKKVEKKGGDLTTRDRLFHRLWDKYYSSLSFFIHKRSRRWFAVIAPVIILVMTFVFLKIPFEMFPSGDNPVINVTVESKDGKNEDSLEPYVNDLQNVFSWIEEVKNYYISIDGNKLSAQVELLKKDERLDRDLRMSNLVEKEISSKVAFLKQDWLKVESAVQAWWPPSWKAVWIKILASSSKDLDELVRVSKDFEVFLRTVEWAKNVWTSSSGTPGQFIFKLDKAKLADLGINPSEFENEVFSRVNWVNAWTYKGQYDDYDIVVKIKEFNEYLSPYDLQNLVIQTSKWSIKLWDVAAYEFKDAISNIDREDTKIAIRVESDVEDGYFPSQLQPELTKFAERYTFPQWIWFEAAWEANENSDLIVSTLISFVITLFIIFGILVLQFNSYWKPAVILYSVVLALLWVNIGLYATGNPYSMPFGIWFIALTWIVINNAIIYIDKVNKNIRDGLHRKEAILEAWKSRLTPMLVTTMTTIFWITPLGFEDEFWAWLAFTMVFGLISWTIMTLFVIPSLYYELFLSKHDREEEKQRTKELMLEQNREEA